MWENLKNSARFLWLKLRYGVAVAIALLIEDHLDGMHSPALLGASDASTADVSIIDAVVKGIACFFGAC